MNDIANRNKLMRERWVNMMEGDFNPGYQPENYPKPEERLARGAEYSAFQLGRISQSLAELVKLMANKKSDAGPSTP